MACTFVGSNPHQFLWKNDLQVCRSKRLGCHTDLHTVSRCGARNQYEDHTGEKAHKQGIHPDFETQGRYHQKSKIGSTKKDLCPPKVVSINLCLCLSTEPLFELRAMLVQMSSAVENEWCSGTLYHLNETPRKIFKII